MKYFIYLIPAFFFSFSHVSAKEKGPSRTMASDDLCDHLKNNGYDLTIGYWGGGYPFIGNFKEDANLIVQGEVENIKRSLYKQCPYMTVIIRSKEKIMPNQPENSIEVAFPLGSPMVSGLRKGDQTTFEKDGLTITMQNSRERSPH